MAAEYRYGVSKTFDAPLAYVYAWCTDYTDDDPRIIGASYSRHILEKNEKRAVWIHRYRREGVEKEGVRLVTFSPPDSWHLDGVNKEKDLSGEYRLTSLDGGGTRLDLVIELTYKEMEPESMEELERGLSRDWDRYKVELEKDYAASKG